MKGLNTKNEIGVLLGRFSPFHRGHQVQLDLMIKERGVANCLVIIGSSNSHNHRTPFTYEERKRIIRQIYPEIMILPLPDINPELVYFDGSTNDLWLDEIKKLEKEMDAKFVFYGGCEEDLKILATQFETKIADSRYDGSIVLSATEVRQALIDKDEAKLSSSLDGRTLALVKQYFYKFQNK